MRTWYFAMFFVAFNANAQVVNVECPKTYPPRDSSLEATPNGHRGKGLVPANSPLEDWGLFDGEFGEPMQIHAGTDVKVAGGTNTEVPPIRWFVCYYRGGVSWWGETGANDASKKGLLKRGCMVQSRANEKAFQLICE